MLEAHLKKGEPKEPHPDECCGKGCSPCVMELYYDKLGEYEDKTAELESMKIEIEEEEDE